MLAASFLSPFRSALADAFVRPWRDRHRLAVFALGILGGFGISLSGYTIQYHIAQLGFGVTSLYTALIIAVSGFLGFPLIFSIMARTGGRWVLVGVQAAGLALIARWPADAVASAVATVALHVPFWAGYHIRFARHRSQDNHGPETALSSLIFLWAGAAGTVTGGWLLQMGRYDLALIGGFTFLALATQLLFRRIGRASFLRAGRKLARQRRVSARFSRLNGSIATATDFCMAAWLLAIGMSPIVSGVMMAARPVLGFLITPLVGRLIQRHGRRAVVVGGLVFALAWTEIGVALLFSSSPFAVLPGFALLAVGNNMVSPAEVGRWYKTRAAAGIVAREYSLTLGRLPAVALLLPIIFHAPGLYPFAALGLSLLLVWGAAARLRRNG